MSVAKLSQKSQSENGLMAGFKLKHPHRLHIHILIQVQLTSALQSV